LFPAPPRGGARGWGARGGARGGPGGEGGEAAGRLAGWGHRAVQVAGPPRPGLKPPTVRESRRARTAPRHPASVVRPGPSVRGRRPPSLGGPPPGFQIRAPTRPLTRLLSPHHPLGRGSVRGGARDSTTTRWWRLSVVRICPEFGRWMIVVLTRVGVMPAQAHVGVRLVRSSRLRPAIGHRRSRRSRATARRSCMSRLTAVSRS